MRKTLLTLAVATLALATVGTTTASAYCDMFGNCHNPRPRPLSEAELRGLAADVIIQLFQSAMQGQGPAGCEFNDGRRCYHPTQRGENCVVTLTDGTCMSPNR